MRTWFVAKLVLLFLVQVGLLVGGGAIDHTWAQVEFTNASLAGRYAVISRGMGGLAPTAGVGTCTFDTGTFLCSLDQNLPGDTFPDRTVGTVSLSGTYQVESAGSGSGDLTATFSDGSTLSSGLNFVITQTMVINNVNVATEASFVLGVLQEQTGNLVTAVIRRLSDLREGTYDIRQ